MKLVKVLSTAILLTPLALQAQTSAGAEQQTVIQAAEQQAFNQAKTLYDARQFSQAYQAFQTLWQKMPASLTVNFYLGSSALELKRYDEAMTAFDRVLMLNPQHTRTRLELARLYFETNEFEMANNELDIALKADLPQPVRNNVLALKAQMDKQRSRHSHAFTVVLGLNYDSNAKNDIGDGESFDLPGFGGLELSGNKEQSDFGFGQTLVYNHGYDFGDRGGWVLNNQLIGFNKINKEISENNLLYFAASTTPTYIHDIYKMTFPLEIERVFVDGKGYLSNQGLGVGLSQMLSPTQTLSFDYKLRSMDYDTAKTRNARANLYSVGYRQAIGRNPLMLGALFSYENREKIGSAVGDIASLTESTLKLDASRALNGKWRLNGAVNLKNTAYKSYSTLFQNKRHDVVARLDLGAMYQLDGKTMLNGVIGHAVHDSNQGPYRFDKTMLAANYIRRF